MFKVQCVLGLGAVIILLSARNGVHSAALTTIAPDQDTDQINKLIGSIFGIDALGCSSDTIEQVKQCVLGTESDSTFCGSYVATTNCFFTGFESCDGPDVAEWRNRYAAGMKSIAKIRGCEINFVVVSDNGTETTESTVDDSPLTFDDISAIIDEWFVDPTDQLICPTIAIDEVKECVKSIQTYLFDPCGYFQPLLDCFLTGFPKCVGNAVIETQTNFSVKLENLAKGEGCSIIADHTIPLDSQIEATTNFRILSAAINFIFNQQNLGCEEGTSDTVLQCLKSVQTFAFDACGRYQPLYDCYQEGFKTCDGTGRAVSANKKYVISGLVGKAEANGCSITTQPPMFIADPTRNFFRFRRSVK